MANENSDNDILLLVEMMEKIRSLLGFFIESYQDIIPEYPEFKKEFIISWELINKNFNDLNKYLQTSADVDLLMKEGLTGDQLRLKSILLTSAYDESIVTFREFKRSTSDEKPKKLSRFRRFVNLFFKHGNSVLGSMADAGIPFVGVIGEFKDAAEITIERAENRKN